MSDKNTQLSLDGKTVNPMPKVRTTDGHIVDWSCSAIINQLMKETKVCESYHNFPAINRTEATSIARSVENHIKSLNIKTLSGPLIREFVNMELLERGHIEWRNVSTRVGSPVCDACETDVGCGFEANENANLQGNAETSHKKKADRISKEQYLLLLPPKLADLHLNGDIHIHDLEYFGTRPFCQDHDLRYFFYYGLMPDGNGTKAAVAGPAMKAEVAMLHAVKALGSAQTNFAGGQGFYNFLTFIAPFFEGKSYIEIEQLIQMFIYEMTQMMVARGGQLVFSSVQLSPGVPKLWKDKPVVYKGKVHDGTNGTLARTYGEFEREVRLGFQAMMNVMLRGDYWGKPFSFPKPEISIEPDFMTEDEMYNKAHPELPTYDDLYTLSIELAAKFGTPYFDNQLPEYRGAGEGISCYQCCAYQFSANPTSDDEFNAKLYFKDGKHFSMGSWQVITMNCPRAAYRADGDVNTLLAILKQQMDSAVEVFKIKRKWMKKVQEANRMPFITQTPKDPNTGKKGQMAVNLDALVYTIGVLGINEMVQAMTGVQMHESKDAYKMAIRVMVEIEAYANQLSQENNMEIALARTPAETTCQRFAVSDLLHEDYKEKAAKYIQGNVPRALEMITETRDLPVYYTNGTHVPPSADINLFDRMNIEHTFFPIVDGGNIFHIWLGEAAPDSQGLKEFVLNLAKNTQIGYFAFTKDMTICTEDSHVMAGLQDVCEKCGSIHVEQISRVTGYLQAVGGWNAAKTQELEDRHRTDSAKFGVNH